MHVQSDPGRMAATVLLLSVVMILAGGCGTYREAHEYLPRPSARAVPAVSPEEADARIYATVVGVRKNLTDIEHPNSVEVRVRVEATGQKTVTLSPDSLRMTTADITALADPAVEPEGPLVVEPGESKELTAFFTLPSAPVRYDSQSIDLSGLYLRSSVEVDGQPYEQSMRFVLARRPRPDPNRYIPRDQFGYGFRGRYNGFNSGYQRRPY